MSARVKVQQEHHSGATAQHHVHAIVSISGDGMSASSAYDADGQRVMTTQPDGTIIYTPFPDYELTDPPTGADTVRTTYRLGGRIVAVQTKVGAAAGAFYFTYTDHLGNISAMSTTAGTVVTNSNARYDPFGTFTTATPGSNRSISNHGFTGHRHNNTGTNNLGLIYMNARYYMPEVGRFISPDSIVPEPKNPQTYNRYSYALNSPVNYTDPTGHCTSNYEAGSQDMVTCLSAWNSVANYLYGAAFGPGGSGNFPNELVSDWLANADIGMLENLMKSYGIDYGFVYAPPILPSRSGPRKYNKGAATCQYWQGCYESVVTREEMKPDAIAGGVSGSAAGVGYGVVGGELVYNLVTKEKSFYNYTGQGAGVALEGDVSVYGALIWNLDKNSDYEGVSPTLTVDLGAGVHGQLSLFWEAGTIPFTGDTWGVSLGPGGGGGFGLTGSFSNYTCQAGCR